MKEEKIVNLNIKKTDMIIYISTENHEKRERLSLIERARIIEAIKATESKRMKTIFLIKFEGVEK